MERLSPVNAWSLEKIVRFMEDNGVTVHVRDGNPGVTGSDWAVAEVLPHLKAKREAVLEYFANLVGEPYPKKAEPPDPEQLAEDRHRVLVATLARSGAVGRPLLYLDGPEPKRYDPNRKERIPPTCKYVCVEGDAGWTDLPGWIVPPPDPKTERKRYRSKWAKHRGE